MKNRIIEYLQENTVFVVALIVLVGGAGIFLATNKSDQLSPEDIKTIAGLKEFDKLENKHQEGPINYPKSPSPPVGGNHNPIWAACDQQVYDQPLQTEMAVHSLEHGAVWITYQPTLDKAKVAVLKAKVKTSGATFLSPYLDQTSPIVLTAWGKQIQVKDTNDKRIDQFLVKYRKGPQAPEPGASCSAPQGA